LNVSAEDEFLPAESDSDFESVTGDLEFSTTSDEFAATEETPKPDNSNYLLYQTIVLLLLAALIGMTIKYSFVRNLRGFVLLLSMVYLGFVGGACPCMIMSLQQVVLFLLGVPVALVSMLWFVGLTVTTYFFGKTWCGWLCHLGALQDFLFREKGRRWLVSERSQKIIKRVQIVLLLALVIQLMLTRSIEFIHYDPFKVAFNMFSANIAGYVLLVLLLLSSVLIYRPFCRIICPVGLILGWITKIPGARKPNVNETTCSDCRRCERRCKQQSIENKLTKIIINTEDCILCGECMDACAKNSISLKIKTK
jgi:polyferredoxin